MARYTGPNNKQSRRVGFSILENGVEFAKGKKRTYGPGQHGADRKKKPSNYAIQLTEKQKLRFTYGVSEKQFANLFKVAKAKKGVVTGTAFMQLLESRLDNLVYRIGFARTRRAARQLVNHGHILVNGKKVDIPSYACKAGDVITLKETSKNLKVVVESLEKTTKRVDFVSYDENKKEVTFLRRPERSELNADINESLIVEYYSRV